MMEQICFWRMLRTAMQVRVTLRTIVWHQPLWGRFGVDSHKSSLNEDVTWKKHVWNGEGQVGSLLTQAMQGGGRCAAACCVWRKERAMKTREGGAESECTLNKVPRASDTLGCFFQWLLGDLSKPRSQT